MNHRFLLLLLCMICRFMAASQQKYPTGLILDDAAYEALPFASDNIKFDLGQKSFESSVDLSVYCPAIRHQGDIASCVGWSLGYGAMTIERAIQNGWTDKRLITQNANSALFVFNQVSQGNCAGGINMPQALQVLQEKGNCLSSEFDHEINDCTREITPDLWEKAQKFKIEDFVPIIKLNAPQQDKIGMVKLALSQKKPVAVGVVLRANFYHIKSGDPDWNVNLGDTTYAGGHAMLVVGYDDNRFGNPVRPVPDDMRGAFKIMNSWGDQWAEKGFVWVRYAHFAQICRHAYVIQVPEGNSIDLSKPLPAAGTRDKTELPAPLPQQKQGQLSGVFGFRRYVVEKDTFEEAKIDWKNGIYELTGTSKIDDQFQLYVKSGFDNGYIYVLSVDASGKGEVHFPRSHEYNDRFTGYNESALLFGSGSELTIPAEDKVLVLKQKGPDYLVALFASQKINPADIRQLGKVLAANKETLPQTLNEILNKYVVPLKDIRYRQSEMGFDATAGNTGKIVPIVLKVEVH